MLQLSIILDNQYIRQLIRKTNYKDLQVLFDQEVTREFLKRMLKPICRLFKHI